jgi:hypothetical protein
MATVLSAIRVIERITGVAWTSLRRDAILDRHGLARSPAVLDPAR